jgi:hypothetical protein
VTVGRHHWAIRMLIDCEPRLSFARPQMGGDFRMSFPTADPLSRRRFLAAGIVGVGSIALMGGIPAWAHEPSSRREPDAEVATAWADLSLMLVQSTPGFTPPVASRAFAYFGITLYQSVVDGSRAHRSLAGLLPGLDRSPRASEGEMSWPVAANAALAAILRSLFPATSAANKAAIDALEASIGERWQRRIPRPVFTRSVSHGRAVAADTFEWSKSDGGHEGYLRNFPDNYLPPVGPGLWVPTPPAFQRALQPTWANNR